MQNCNVWRGKAFKRRLIAQEVDDQPVPMKAEIDPRRLPIAWRTSERAVAADDEAGVEPVDRT